jgi:hypothetical protein
MQQDIKTKAGAIDRDYPGNETILLQNKSDKPYQVNKHDRIAQLIIYPIKHPMITETQYIPTTQSASGGFGSTGSRKHGESQEDTIEPTEHIHSIEDDNTTDRETHTAPYSIWLSQHPFHKTMDIKIPLTGTHGT